MNRKIGDDSYALQPNYSIFASEYKALTIALNNYIESITSSDLPNPKMDKLVSDWETAALTSETSRLLIVDFNVSIQRTPYC
jgi:hypothetical protein